MFVVVLGLYIVWVLLFVFDGLCLGCVLLSCCVGFYVYVWGVILLTGFIACCYCHWVVCLCTY